MSETVGSQTFRRAISNATTYWASAPYYAIYLPKGAVWRIDQLIITAATKYAAQDTNYNTFLLYDASGNIIGGVRNGPASGGLDINFAVASTDGVQSAFTATYKYIDARANAVAVYVTPAVVGTGVTMYGVEAIVVATPLRG
jgi:hypothetical protein